MLHSNWIQTRNKAKGRHGDPGSSLPSWVPWPLWIGELDLGVLASLAKDFLRSWVPDSPAPAWQVWWVYEFILDADFHISKNYKLSMQNVNAARPRLVYSLRLSGFLHQLTRWKKGMGGAGSSWQGCWKKLDWQRGAATGLTVGSPPAQREWWAQAGICASFRGAGLFEAVLPCLVSATCCSIPCHLSRTERPCACQKPDSSPVRFVFLLILLCLQTDSIHHVALHSNRAYQSVLFLWEQRFLFSLHVSTENICSPWHVAGTRWPCLHPYLLE